MAKTTKKTRDAKTRDALMHTFRGGLQIPKGALSPEMRRKEIKFNKIERAALKVRKSQEQLAAIVEAEFGSNYSAAKAEGRKQITVSDFEGLRRIVIKHQKRVTLDDSAFSAKTLIDDFIAEHTKTSVNPDYLGLFAILKRVFTGSKKLVWNTAMQAFLDYNPADERLKEAQRIIKGAKHYDTSRNYVTYLERDEVEDEFDEVARY